MHGPHAEMKNGMEKRPKAVVLELAKSLAVRPECELLLQLLRSTVQQLGCVKVEELLQKSGAILDFSLPPSGSMELKASMKRALSTSFKARDDSSASRESSAYSAKTWSKKTPRSSDP